MCVRADPDSRAGWRLVKSWGTITSVGKTNTFLTDRFALCRFGSLVTYILSSCDVEAAAETAEHSRILRD